MYKCNFCGNSCFLIDGHTICEECKEVISKLRSLNQVNIEKLLKEVTK